jgi:glucan phosphoethanolaminetransferase (alkaline phosphatase superfamily)
MSSVVDRPSANAAARSYVAELVGILFLTCVFLAPALVPLLTLRSLVPLPEWPDAAPLSNGQLEYAAQYTLLAVGVALALLSAIFATYPISLLRRTVHILSFSILLELFYRFAYGGPVSVGVLLSVGETSHRESWELIIGHPALSASLTLVAIMGFFALIIAWNARPQFSMAIALRLALLALALAALSAAIGIHGLRSATSVTRLLARELAGTFPIDLVSAAQSVVRTEWDDRRNAAARAAFHFANARMVDAPFRSTGREIYIIVIGETSRRSNWSLYGYPRDTTPRLRELRNELFIFNHVTSNATNTIQSLPLALSRAETTNLNRFRSERSIVSLLKQAGFETSWISNQERSQSFSNPITQIALEADNVSFPDALSGEATGDRHDSNLLGRLDDRLSRSSSNAKAAVFLHMEGSHFRYKDRYPAGTGRFPDADHPPRLLSKRKARLANEYDNSIYFTDYVLQQIIARLQHCECRAGLLFFSDHGERLFDNGPADDDFGHGYPTVTLAEIEVPFFIFLSKDYRMHNPALVDTLMAHANAVATLHNVFETIVDLAGVTYDGRSSDLSLLSKSFLEPTSRSVLDVNENVISFPAQEYPNQPGSTWQGTSVATDTTKRN